MTVVDVFLPTIELNRYIKKKSGFWYQGTLKPAKKQHTPQKLTRKAIEESDSGKKDAVKEPSLCVKKNK